MARRVSSAVPEGFTLSMAFMDTLPVIFFSIAMAVLTTRFASRLFLVGAILVILAGSLKAGWKFVIALAHQDVQILNRQMRYLMPTGFLLMLAGLVVDHQAWSMSDVIAHCTAMPSVIFFVCAVIGIACMVWLAGHADGRDAKSNWMEQGVNSLAQLFFLLGILL